MPANWTQPHDFVTGELVTADLMNTHLRDNLEWLKDPPAAEYLFNESANYTTTSTSFVDVDATLGKFRQDITTAGGDVMVGFCGTFLTSSAGAAAYLELLVDGAAFAGDDGLLRHDISATNDPQNIAFVVIVPGLAEGELHTFKLQWKTTAGTLTLYVGAGTASHDVHPQFWVREV